MTGNLCLWLRGTDVVRKCYIHIFQPSACRSDLILIDQLCLLLYTLKDIRHEAWLSRGLTFLRPLDPSLLSLCYISDHILPLPPPPHTTPPAFFFSLLTSSTFKRMSLLPSTLTLTRQQCHKSALCSAFLIILFHFQMFGRYLM